MAKDIRRYISILLAAVLIAVMLPSVSFAEEEHIEYGEIGDSGYIPDGSRTVNPIAAQYTELVARLKKGMDEYATSVDVSDLNIPYTGSNDDKSAIAAVFAAAAVSEYFYVSNYFLWKYSTGTYSTTLTEITLLYKLEYGTNRIDDLYSDSPNVTKIKEDRAKYEAAEAQALSVVKPGMTDLEKALVLHDHIARICKYSTVGSYPDMHYTGYSALVDGEAVCQGYALLYESLLRKTGVENYVVACDDVQYVGAHGWNLVKIDGNWYHVDVTWDDPVMGNENTMNQNFYLTKMNPNADVCDEGYVSHAYFLRSDAEFNDMSLSNSSHAPGNAAISPWTVRTGPTITLPAAPESGFGDYAFRADNVQQETSFAYANGKWYYMDINADQSSRRTLRCSELDKTGAADITDLVSTAPEARDYLFYPVSIGDKVYVTTFNGIIEYDAVQGTHNTIVDYSADAVRYITEMTRTNDGRIKYVVWTNAANTSSPTFETLYYTPVVTAFAPGDTDLSGTITLIDVVLICRHIVNSAALTGHALDAADFNGDGSVDVADVLGIIEIIAA